MIGKKKKLFSVMLVLTLILLLSGFVSAADATAPTTTFSSFQVPNTSDQNITLTCTDNNSGCKYIHYNINSTGWIRKNIDNNVQTYDYNSTEYSRTSTAYAEVALYNLDKNKDGNPHYIYVQSIKANNKYTLGTANVKYRLYFADGTTEDTSEATITTTEYSGYTYTVTTKNKDVNKIGLWLKCSAGGTVYGKDTNAIEYIDYIDSNPYSFLKNGAGDHNIQYYSTDNSDNNETTKFSYFPQFQTTNDPSNSRILLEGVPIYNNYNVTTWQWTINGNPLSGTTDQNKYYSTQANLDLNVCLTTNSTDTTCKSTKTWDTITPTIDANVSNSSYGFVSTFDLNYNMTCYDNFSPIKYLITWNNGTTDYTLYNSSDVNATLKTGTLDLNAGQNASITFRCIDDSNNTATFTSNRVYALVFRLVNEVTKANFDLNKVTAAQAFTYDGNFIYNFKDANQTTTNFFSPTQTIRFDFTYPDTEATKISREVNFDYLDDSNVGICVAEYQQFYLYRFLSTSVKPIIVYNDFAKCYSLASTTKFLYNTYQSNTAYTINKPYYLYTYSNGVKTLLALLDGANNTEINLDILAFNQAEYSYVVNTDVISFKPSGDDTNTVQFYFYSPNQNDSVTLQIYNGSTLLWTYTELVDTNSFEVNFFYGDLNVTDTNLLKVVATVVLDGESSSFYKYFNTKAEVYQGVIHPIVAIVISFFIMFFGLTMVSYRFAMGWFGLAVSLISIGILALAPPDETIIFIQAIYLIIGIFIGIIGKEQNLGVSS